MKASLVRNAIADAPWGIGGSVIYFLVFTLVVFVAGIVVLRRRDV